MREVRIVSGFHRGVSLPLDDDPIMIGSSLEADIVLSDPGIAEVHVEIQKNEEGWTLVAKKSGVFDENHNEIKSTNVQSDQIFNVNGIWVQVTDKESPWPSSDALNFKVIQDNTNNVVKLRKKDKKGKKFKMMAFSAIAFLGVLAATHANVNKPVEDVSEEVLASLSTEQKSKKIDGSTKKPLINKNELLIPVFKKMLKERDLQDVDMQVSGDVWTLNGSVEPEAIEILKRMIVRFSKHHPHSLTINNNVEPIDYSLPFEIVRVVSGPYGHVEESEGNKIYLGSEYKGMKLVSITKDELVFSGKSNITVSW